MTFSVAVFLLNGLTRLVCVILSYREKSDVSVVYVRSPFFLESGRQF